MIQARILGGRVEPGEPIPAEWEGQLVKISPMTPDDPIPDLAERLAALRVLGPMEFDPDEQQALFDELAELDRISKSDMDLLGGELP